MRAVRSRGVGLVREQRVRAAAGATRAEPGDPKTGQQRRQHRGVPAVAGADQHHQWPAPTIDECVGLGRQPAPGATDAVIDRFVPELRQIFVVR